MKIIKNTSILSDSEVLRRVADFTDFFSEIFPVVTGHHKYIAMPDGTVSSNSGLEGEIIIDHGEIAKKPKH